jgi:hypothetical protein
MPKPFQMISIGSLAIVAMLAAASLTIASADAVAASENETAGGVAGKNADDHGDNGGEKYLLRYQFHPGETLRWEVEHRNKVRTTMTKITKTMESVTTSVKSWHVIEVKSDGTATFEHRVDWADMIQDMTDAAEMRYDSRTGAKPPEGFEDAAKRVGVPLSRFTIDPQGTVLKRERLADAKNANKSEGFITIPLPKEPVPIGYTWSYPEDIDVPLETGGSKKIKAVQMFTLEEVKTGVATIRVATEIITPVTSAAIESKLVQRESAGRVRFDIDAGRVLGQKIDVDKQVVGFRGDASSIHYVDRFNEQLISSETITAEKSAPAKN